MNDEHEQRIEARRLHQMGIRKAMVASLGGTTITTTQEPIMAPYQFMARAKDAERIVCRRRATAAMDEGE